ncbi:MAG: hydrogenase, partial [Arcobacteraceae bacterium]
MKIVLLCTSFNSLSQKFYEELRNLKHDVNVEFALSAESMIHACTLFKPDLILCPFLKQKVPETIWQNYSC